MQINSHNKYIHSGTCIWCKQSEPDVSFKNAPHIVPHAIGGEELGFDICDECNHYFGTAGKGSPLNTNLVFKEVFMASLHSLGDNARLNCKYSSTYFPYNKESGTIKLKRNLHIAAFTNQFKRTLFEVFLQKYHKTFPDETLDKFEAVRKYARYGVGNLRVYFAYTSILHIIRLFFTPQTKRKTFLFR